MHGQSHAFGHFGQLSMLTKRLHVHAFHSGIRVRTVVTYPFSYGTANKLWNVAVEKYASRPAITFAGKGDAVTRTYAEMDVLANKYAHLLQQRYGVSKGDRVVTVAQNRMELVSLLIACQKTNAVFTPLASELARNDLEMLTDRYEGKLVVIEDGAKGFGDTSVQARLLEGQAESMPCSPLPDNSKPDDTCLIFSTSGTTSLPKGVMWSSESLATIYKELAEVDTEKEQWTQLLWVPLRGVVTPILLMQAIHAGAHSVFVDHFPSAPPTWAKMMSEHEVESMLLFGGAMSGMIQACPGETFEGVRTIAYGGSPVPVPVSHQSMKQFPNAKFQKIWGMSEVGIGCCLGPEGHVPADGDPHKLKQMESCGRPFPGGEAKIEHPNEQGEGQLLFAVPTMMQGYFRNPEKTKEDLPDGKWMRTGDLAKIDEDGNVYIVDRIKDVICTEMGQNVAPVDIEKVLMRHPAIGEAGVVGITHPSQSGEMIVAHISLKKGQSLTPSEIKVFVESSEMLAPWQFPKSYEITDKPLPKPSGKILKRALRSAEFVRENLGDHILENMKMKPAWEDQASVVFSSMDYKGSGKVDVEEMAHIVGPRSAAAVVDAFDVNRDGGDVTRAKFFHFLWQLDDRTRSDLLLSISTSLLDRQNLAEKMLRIMQRKPAWLAEAEKVFDGMDKDGSGTVSLEEFSHVVGVKHAPAVVQAMDVNRDGGGVTRAKFFNLLWHLDDVTRTQTLLKVQSALASGDQAN